MNNIFWKEGMAYWHSDKQNWDETPSRRTGTTQCTKPIHKYEKPNPTAFDIISDKSSPYLTLEDTEVSLVHLMDLTVDCEWRLFGWGLWEHHCRVKSPLRVFRVTLFSDPKALWIWGGYCIDFIHTSLTWKAQHSSWPIGTSKSPRIGGISDSSQYRMLSLEDVSGDLDQMGSQLCESWCTVKDGTDSTSRHLAEQPPQWQSVFLQPGVCSRRLPGRTKV